MTRAPHPHELAKPFQTWPVDSDELAAIVGTKNWVVARRTASIVAKYGEDVKCLSPKAYHEAEQAAMDKRGWNRPCETVIRDLIWRLAVRMGANTGLKPQASKNATQVCTLTYSGRDALDGIPEVVAARELLAKAREP